MGEAIKREHCEAQDSREPFTILRYAADGVATAAAPSSAAVDDCGDSAASTRLVQDLLSRVRDIEPTTQVSPWRARARAALGDEKLKALSSLPPLAPARSSCCSRTAAGPT